MSKLTGVVLYRVFAEGTKSESSRPYIFLENGSQILLYKKSDNPFENKGFINYENQTITVEGEFSNGVFIVENILEDNKLPKNEEE